MKNLQATDEALLRIREQWRERSLATIWLRSGDWFHEAVDGAIRALLDGEGVLDAVESLGAARGHVGVGIGETIDDLACLYEVALGAVPPLTAVRALSEGWAEANASPFVGGTCTDPESGLPTSEYLAVRLREEIAAVRRAGGDPTAELSLLLVDVARDGVSPGDRLARSAVVGMAVELAFGEGYPTATLGGGVFAVLLAAGAGSAASAEAAERLRRQIDAQGTALGVQDVLRRPPRVWVEAMPPTHREAVALLTTRRPSGDRPVPGVREALLPWSPFSSGRRPPYQGARSVPADAVPPFVGLGRVPPYSPEPLPPAPRRSPEDLGDDHPDERP